MAAVLSKPPTRSVERAALANALEELRAYVARRQALARALADAETAARVAARAFESAAAAVTEAKEASVRHLVEVAASGIASDPPQSTRAARNALEDAEDERDTRRSALDQLRAQLSEPDNSVSYRMKVDAAIDRVLTAEASQQAQAVVDAANKARVELVHAILLTQYLDGRVFDRNSHVAITSLSQYPLSSDYDRERPIATARWRAAIDALAADPDAVLDLG